MKGASNHVLTIPNGLTLSRLLAIPVVILLLLAKRDLAAAISFALAAATDFLDGSIARRRGGASYFGMILDPITDRLLLSSVAVAMAIRGFLPVYLVGILVGRDALALLGSLVFRGKIKVNGVGKAATATLMASVAVVMYRPGSIGEAMFYAGLGLSLIAGAFYLRAAKRTFGGAR